MNEDKFAQLVNLYIDREISERGLAELKVELTENAERRADFLERCHLHEAMRLALDPEGSKQWPTSPKCSDSGNVSNLSRRGGSSDTRGVFPRWILGGGLAASLVVGVIGFTLLIPAFQDTAPSTSWHPLEGGEADLLENAPLDQVSRVEMRRFATVQKRRSANERASIAAQFRLMGLRPELIPEEKELRSVNVMAAHSSVPTRSNADLLTDVQRMSPMPDIRILQAEALEAESSSRWPGGFHSSLASFK